MTEFRMRDLHLVKKALCIAMLAIERQPGPFQPASDLADMKAILEDLFSSDVELGHYMRSANTALTGAYDRLP